MIETYNLTKQFKDLVAVNDLNLKINKGDIFGFIGPNGAGKTTTIKMLSTLLKPTSGYAEINGLNIITQYDEVKRIIGYMPEFFGVYDEMKVWEYLDFFAAAYKIPLERRKKVVDDVLSLTDLTIKKDDFIEGLSRGMKQRLCLAKTLIHDPQVLLLDEPASGLDPRARIELRELLKELRNMGKTILISSHILTELSDFCNTIGIIEQGTLLCSGNVDDIIEKLKVSKIIELKIKDNSDKAVGVISGLSGVKKVNNEGNNIEIELSLEVEDSSVILEKLLQNNIKVIEIKEKEINLEDIFMKITKGNVQ